MTLLDFQTNLSDFMQKKQELKNLQEQLLNDINLKIITHVKIHL